VIVTETDDDTAFVVIWNVARLAPLGTRTLTGTCAALVLLLLRVTVAPLAGASPVNITVPVELLPPVTDDGFAVTDDNAAAFTVTVAVRVTPNVPEIVTDVLVETGVVVIVKFEVVEPADTVTVAGT
jgi:hypothetical protein